MQEGLWIKTGAASFTSGELILPSPCGIKTATPSWTNSSPASGLWWTRHDE